MMMPTLTSQRLILRPFLLTDIKRIQQLANDSAVVDMTSNVPYPCHEKMVENWIKNHKKAFKSGSSLILAIVVAENNCLIGSISLLDISSFHQRAEIGYWLGNQFWQKGYATEATKKLLEYGFNQLKLNRIEGRCMARNQASAKVMLKAGLKFEGERKQQMNIHNRLEDIHYFGLVNEDLLT